MCEKDKTKTKIHPKATVQYKIINYYFHLHMLCIPLDCCGFGVSCGGIIYRTVCLVSIIMQRDEILLVEFGKSLVEEL